MRALCSQCAATVSGDPDVGVAVAHGTRPDVGARYLTAFREARNRPSDWLLVISEAIEHGCTVTVGFVPGAFVPAGTWDGEPLCRIHLRHAMSRS